MEQKYIIKNCKSFKVKDIFECGQCFRWSEEPDESYTGIFGHNVLNVKEEKDIVITGICNGDIEDICKNYFDLDRNYEEIKKTLSLVDDNMKESIKYGEGIRILNQDLWEMIISFIISANNNIPRIKGIIERMSAKYGQEIKFRGTSYYTFPTIDELSQASVKNLKDLGLGFRDRYVYETTKKIKEGKINLENLKQEPTNEVRKQLLTLTGVGPKVADCIMLFSTLKRFDVFPVDVWVRRVMNDLYIHNEDETKVNKKQIQEIARDKFGALEGIAQQYLFYWKRES